ncbi:MAG TPA: mechanosensitive ion channel family protein [Thermoanaerobaculia bacterium]|nr:mechanosensitive ion channel family protein [Thermoanaerobaculia bacterium]
MPLPSRLFRHLPPLLAVLLAVAAACLGPADVRAQLPLPEPLGGPAQVEPAEDEGIFPDRPPERTFLTEDIFDPTSWPGLGRHYLTALIDWLPSLVAAVLVLALFYAFHRMVAGVLRRVMARTRADPAAQDIAARLAKYALLSLGVVMAVSQLGINVASLLAGVGIIGLALGLAAQDSLGNLVAGLTILWDRPFRIGDNVTVAGTFGKVQEIGLRSTRIRTVSQLDAILPNKEIINQQILNHTLNPMMRLGIPLGIAYKEDTREARRVLLAAVEGHELLLDKPEPQVVVTGLGDSAVNLELRVWLRDPYTEREATFAMIEIAKIALDEAGIEIPFPQRTLHLPAGVRVVREGGADSKAP